MEASAAGLAGDGGQQQQQQGEGGGEAQGVDVGQLAEQLQSMQGSQEQMFQFLQSQPWVQQDQGGEQEQQVEDEGFDLSFLDPAQAEFDPSTVAERLQGVIDQAVQQRVQQHVNPLAERIDEERWNREAQALIDEFPDFGDESKATEIVGAARQIAEAYGQPKLANEPWFWRMTYMAQQTAESVAQEGAEAPEAAHLEGGGGARPGGQQVDLGDAIVNAHAGRRVLPFG